MKTTRFLCVSLALLLVIVGAGFGMKRWLAPASADTGFWIAAFAAYVVGTAGWSVAIQGLHRDPKVFPAFFFAGLMVKLFLMGLAVVIVRLTVPIELTEFLVPFAVIFAIFGIGQMVIVARAATAMLGRRNADPTGR